MDENEPGSAKPGRAADQVRGSNATLCHISFAEPIEGKQVEIAIKEDREERAFEFWRQRSDIVDRRTPARELWMA